MPVLKRDDAEIYYEEYGDGFPILLFAPGGMKSRLEMWQPPADGKPRPWTDWTDALAKQWKVIAMDQRNAGQSHGAVAADHGWHTYAADQLALMDHLGHERIHTLGGCIGSSYCLGIEHAAPGRTAAMVLQNPIGLNPDCPNLFPELFAAWADEQRAERDDLNDADLDSFCRNMFGGEFVFNVSREFVANCQVPALVLRGDDDPHPTIAGVEVADLLPNSERLMDWKGRITLRNSTDGLSRFSNSTRPSRSSNPRR